MINLNIEEIDKETLQLVNAIEIRTTYYNIGLTEEERKYFFNLKVINDKTKFLFHNFELDHVHLISYYPERGQPICRLAFMGRQNKTSPTHTLMLCHIIGLRCKADVIIRHPNEIADYLDKNRNDIFMEIYRMEKISQTFREHSTYFLTNEAYKRDESRR